MEYSETILAFISGYNYVFIITNAILVNLKNEKSAIPLWGLTNEIPADQNGPIKIQDFSAY